MTGKISLFLLLLSILTSCSKKPKDIEIKSPINDLPYLSGTSLDGQEVAFRNLSGNTILIVFFADCDHCQREAMAIREKRDAFQKYNLYFLSSNTSEEIRKFAKDYQLNDLENVTFVKVDGGRVVQTFGAIPTPSVYIYSSQRKLVKQFNGETNIEEIIKFL